MKSHLRPFLCWGILLGGFLSSACADRSVVPPESPDTEFVSTGWLQGYQTTINGGTIAYHSPHPDATSALLVRSLDSRDHVEWETESVPDDFRGEAATFVWIFGMDVDSSPCSYDLFIDGKKWFRFANPRVSTRRDWQIEGPQGSRLRFRVTMVDRHGDVFGYAALTLPSRRLESGRPIRLKVAGESAGSRVWYMTFQSQVKAEADVLAQPALVTRNGELFQPVDVRIIHLGPPTTARVWDGATVQQESTLEFGFNRIPAHLPQSDREVRHALSVQIGDRDPMALEFVRKPVRPWVVYLVQHTHTDIGYTRPQTEILAEHLRFIDYALDYCDLTDSFPDDARFRWTCEAAWAVEEYLKVRPPEQLNRLKERIRQGRIELTGMLFNLSEMADENMVALSLRPLKRFHREGLDVTTAMQNDVNGIAWCLADYFPDTGVRYLIMGQHGHRARIPFDKPTAFWWESPSGRRLLAFRADHYNTGNFWGIHTGEFDATERELLRYLKALEQKGYPFERVAVQYAGYFTDNSPPAKVGSEFIRGWNRKYAWPKLRSATAREFPMHLEKHQGPGLPVYRVAWPDWWSDGFGSSARETAFARRTQAHYSATLGLLAMARLLGSPLSPDIFRRMDRIERSLLFWDEHTMGAAESIRDPLAENSMVQWAEKSAYVWEAVKENRLLQEAAMGLVQVYVPRLDTATLAVFNTLNRPRSGLVEVYIDHEILPPGRDFRLVDESGTPALAQKSRSRADGTYWSVWTADVPPLGFKVYRILPLKTTLPSLRTSRLEDGVLENGHYRLTLDPAAGGIKSWVDKDWNRDLIDGESPWLLGQFILERISNRGQLEQFHLIGAERSTLERVTLEPGVDGPIWKSLIWSGETDTAVPGTRLRCEARLFHPAKRLELHYTLVKKDITDPEAVYVAFPFTGSKESVTYEAQGGAVVPGRDQLEGTSADWHAVQNFFRIAAAGGHALLCSDEIPLAHIGGLNLGKFQYISRFDKPHVFSWVMNNYWVTNFRASQRGEFHWRYALTSQKRGTPSEAARFGWGTRIPLLTRVLPPGRRRLALSASLLRCDRDNILLVAARPEEQGAGLLLHLRETEGRETSFSLISPSQSNHPLLLTEANVLGEVIGPTTSLPRIRAYESNFYRWNPAGR